MKKNLEEKGLSVENHFILTSLFLIFLVNPFFPPKAILASQKWRENVM
jgi:hypothetical protein